MLCLWRDGALCWTMSQEEEEQDGMAATTKEEEFATQFARECAFVSCCLSVDTPSGGWWADRVEEVPLTQSIDSEGLRLNFRGHHIQG
jgi:hypothetical protein